MKKCFFILPILPVAALLLAGVLPCRAQTNSFGVVLDATNLAWSTSGDTSWFVETTNVFDTNSAAAQSGIVTNEQASTLTATVYGPGILNFYWSCQAANPNFDLEFDIDGGYADDIYGETPWIQDGPFTFSPGPHTLTWTAYAGTDNDPTEAGFLDQVSYEFEQPYVSLTNQICNGTNLTFSFQSLAGLNNPVEYSTNLLTGPWQFYTNLPGDGTVLTVNFPLSLFAPSKIGFVRLHP